MEYKRVEFLYIVSTKAQVEEDDIPMQKKACADFIVVHSYWKLQYEYSEKWYLSGVLTLPLRLME